MEKRRQQDLLHHLRAELTARRKYLVFWEGQEPIELFKAPIFLTDLKADLVEAAKVEIKVMEQAVRALEDGDA